MNGVLKTLSSSVGRKFVMGITGLLLCGFLVAHLAGNALLYVGPDAYNHYAHSLHAQVQLLKVAEIGLLLLFAIHIYLAFTLTFSNRAARGAQPYAVKRSKLDVAPRTTSWPLHPEAWMFISGSIVLFFVIWHLSEFTFQIRHPGSPGEEPFDKAIRLLRDDATTVVYIIGSVILGIHLWHGFASSFRSLGISHPRIDTAIKWLAVLFAAAIGFGFASFPLFARMVRWTAGGP